MILSRLCNGHVFEHISKPVRLSKIPGLLEEKEFITSFRRSHPKCYTVFTKIHVVCLEFQESVPLDIYGEKKQIVPN